MCGIAGIVYNNSKLKDSEKFWNAASLSAHRGPDFKGIYGDELSDFVHYRLSILDLDDRSNQPFSKEGFKTYLIYNGEIYNYKDLAKKYSLQLNTTSDTEVLYNLVNNKEFDLKELNGIFAFAFYDKLNKRLVITRDRLGVKPLYYYHDDKYFIFASEAKVIYRYLDQLEINYQVFAEFIAFGHSTSNETIVNGIKKVEPGTLLNLDLTSFEKGVQRYWSIESNILKTSKKPEFNQAVKTTRTLLEKAVKRQCISDVQVGAYLSGGIDSSAVVAFASSHTDNKLNTFSVSFDKNPESELKLAAQVAKKYGTNHHEFEVTATHLDQFLEELVFQYDEPFADPAMIPLHLMAQKASIYSKVVLQGDGGDEVFAGYGRHLEVQQLKLRKAVTLLLSFSHPSRAFRDKMSRNYKRLNHGSESILFAHLVDKSLSIENKNYFENNILKEFEKADPYKLYKKYNEIYKNLPLLQRALYIDMNIILPFKFLEKVDKVNMLHSIEARVPFLDNDLVEYALTLPANYKLRKGTTKYLLRKALQGIVPNDILNAKKKSFGTPFAEWLSSSLYGYAIDIFSKGEAAGFPINYAHTKMLLEKLKVGQSKEQAGLVWRILILTIWLNLYQQKLSFKFN